jgi:hypothetical protein
MGAVFTEDERKILMKSLTGRSVLPSEPGKNQPAEVFIVRSLLAGFELKYDKQVIASKWPWNVFAIASRYVASHSRSTHWAAEIRDNYYETFRQKQYGWPKWAATLRMTDMETALRERIVVERVYVGKTTLSDREIASRGEQRITRDNNECLTNLLKFGCMSSSCDLTPLRVTTANSSSSNSAKKSEPTLTTTQ